MGINVSSLRFLLYAKSIGADFSKTAMIGRQRLHFSFDQFCGVMESGLGRQIERSELDAIYKERYAEGLLKYLGAKEVHSFDYSDYEGATYVHDLNQPLPEQHFGQYSAVIEGGTLEHVFNFPTAVRNCMQMVTVGGHYLGMTPANNYMGHGFYQFSPELYFRVFSADNGFRVEDMILDEKISKKKGSKWYRVVDPESIGRRVKLVNSKSTSLLILASKLKDCPIFSVAPLQSDYQPRWDEKGATRKFSKQKGSRIIRRIVGSWRKKVLRQPHPDFFKPFSGH